MLVRIAVNVTMTVQPFYLSLVTKFEASEENPTPPPLALVPLLSYIMSMIFSIWIQRPMTRCLRSRIAPMFISFLIITVTSVPLFFLNVDNRIWVYPLSTIQGVGIAIMLNNSTSLISDVIGTDSENSAFVYGCYSLFDKFANGVLLYWIIATFSEDADALKAIMATVPTICSLLAFVSTYLGFKFYSHKLAKITGIRV